MGNPLRRRMLAWLLFFATAMLAACGGGSDSHAPLSGDAAPDAVGRAAPREAAQAALGALSNGGSVSGSITSTGQTNSYTFTGSAGQGVLLSAARLSGTLNPQITLYNPAGQYLTYAANSQVTSLFYTLPTTGTYTVVIQHRYSSAGTGSYEIHYARGAGANEHGALPNGGFKAGAITLGDLDSYTFSANVGQGVLLSVARTSGTLNPLVYVFGPGGDYRTYSANTLVTSIHYTPVATGTHTVVVLNRYDNGNTGNYEIHYARGAGANEHGALTNGGFKSGAITTGDLDSYTFSANVGQGVLLSVARTSGTLNPIVYVFGPSGDYRTYSANTLVTSIHYTPVATGTHTVVVFNRYDNGSTGNYEIHYARGAGANEHGTLPNGGFKSGTITTGDLDSYTFSANVGQGVLLSVARTSGTLNPIVYVFGPSGDYRTYSANTLVTSIHYTPVTTGTHTVVVFNRYDNGSTGNYEIHYARGAAANEHGELARGVAKSQTITLGDLDSYTFSATAGQSRALTVSRTSGTLAPMVYVFDPTGRYQTYVANATHASTTVTARVTGVHRVVVMHRYDNGGTGGYLITAN